MVRASAAVGAVTDCVIIDSYLSIYPHYDSTILQTYGGLISLYLAYEIGSLILRVLVDFH
jgi:hypothetical protein